jgi:hypothetical protein
MSVKRLGKSLMVWATSPFDKSWLRYWHHKTVENNQKMDPENSQHTAVWNHLYIFSSLGTQNDSVY